MSSRLPTMKSTREICSAMSRVMSVSPSDVGSRLGIVIHDFPIIASITWTRTIFVMVAAGNVVA